MTLIQEKNEKGYVMIEVCPERYIDIEGSDLDISLIRRDMRSKFGYIILCVIKHFLTPSPRRFMV